ncbi:MAG: substrate-binding domain-containing protein [Chloroflexi bacterium]|nr:substrate-binding domain-containing protein [Chloroflexota bacterium]
MPKYDSSHTRSTIGLLIGRADEPISWTTWMGVEAVTQERGDNLICFVGEALHSPQGLEAQANVIYDLVSPEVLDGLVIWGGGLTQYVGPEEISALCEQYRPLPIISAALPLDNIPCILVDNYRGMYDAMVHLVQVHSYCRIAFIRGPAGHPEAEERYRAYTDVLAEWGISFDADLVAPGEFSRSSGVEAVALWVDQQKLRPQDDFEAIVAVDDITAFGAIEALRARGIRVPGDVAVVGFDDEAEAKVVTPPLTTVRQPAYEQGRRVAEMLFALMADEKVPERMTPSAELVVRQSCGCLSPTVSQAAVGSVTETDVEFAVTFAARREEILKGVQAVGTLFSGMVLDKVEQYRHL